jgi:hypothetical protein
MAAPERSERVPIEKPKVGCPPRRAHARRRWRSKSWFVRRWVAFEWAEMNTLLIGVVGGALGARVKML